MRATIIFTITLLIFTILSLIIGPLSPIFASEQQKSSVETIMKNHENTPLMKSYLENQPEEFEKQLANVPQKTLEEFLTLAIDQRRDAYIPIVLKRMPSGWKADTIAEEMVKNHSLHAFQYLVNYTSETKHSAWLTIAVNNGDADLAKALAKKVSKAEASEYAKKTYQNIRNTKLTFKKARYATVFEVFRPLLPTKTVKEYYDQAIKDGEKIFSDYLVKKMN